MGDNSHVPASIRTLFFGGVFFLRGRRCRGSSDEIRAHLERRPVPVPVPEARPRPDWGLRTGWQRLPGTADGNLFQNSGLNLSCRFLNMDQSHPEPPDNLMQTAVTS